jgi:hypothetical protein
MGPQNPSTPKKRKAPVILTETVTPTGFSQSTWEDNKAARSQKQAKFVVICNILLPSDDDIFQRS